MSLSSTRTGSPTSESESKSESRNKMVVWIVRIIKESFKDSPSNFSFVHVTVVNRYILVSFSFFVKCQLCLSYFLPRLNI